MSYRGKQEEGESVCVLLYFSSWGKLLACLQRYSRCKYPEGYLLSFKRKETRRQVQWKVHLSKNLKILGQVCLWTIHSLSASQVDLPYEGSSRD